MRMQEPRAACRDVAGFHHVRSRDERVFSRTIINHVERPDPHTWTVFFLLLLFLLGFIWTGFIALVVSSRTARFQISLVADETRPYGRNHIVSRRRLKKKKKKRRVPTIKRKPASPTPLYYTALRTLHRTRPARRRTAQGSHPHPTTRGVYTCIACSSPLPGAEATFCHACQESVLSQPSGRALG